jgi:hypothetical protein
MAKTKREPDWVRPLKRVSPPQQKTSKIKEIGNEFARQIVALWELIFTISLFMSAYVLYQQESLTLLCLAGVLSLGGALIAIKHYSKR